MTDAGIETELVTLRKYEGSTEPHLARGRLEAEGIDSAVADEHLADYNLFYGRTMGGVRLLVRSEDAPPAASILDEERVEYGDPRDARCPACGSERVRHGLAPQNPLYMLLLLVILAPAGLYVLIFLRWRWYCEDCGRKWRQTPTTEGDDA